MVRPMRSWSAVVFAVAVMIPARAEEQSNGVALRVYPRQAFAPATVQVTVLIEPDAHIRHLVVEAESGMFYRRTDQELEGTNAARLHVFRWRNLPEGDYMVTATVVFDEGTQEQARDRVHVLP
jgi:hypothetical protein